MVAFLSPKPWTTEGGADGSSEGADGGGELGGPDAVLAPQPDNAGEQHPVQWVEARAAGMAAVTYPLKAGIQTIDCYRATPLSVWSR